MSMALAIANVARVFEPAVQTAVVLDHLVHAAAMMDGLERMSAHAQSTTCIS